MTKNFINFVPEEIMFNILTRLTTESVLECKLVWKSWKRLIHHPSFAQLHLTHLNLPPNSSSGCVEAWGFGYLPSTSEYKVVQIYGFNSLEVEVYTVGSGNGWRNVGKFDFTFHPYYDNVGVFANGALHWRNRGDSGKVVVFDLADAKFLEHISPPPMLPDVDDDIDEFAIGVCNGILFYGVDQTTEEGERLLDVWLLNKKEQGGQLSFGWSKEFSLSHREPFTFTNRGHSLFYDQGRLKYYRSDLTSHIFMSFSDICRQVFPHKHTLISLKQLGEEDTENMKAREVEESGVRQQ
ncbi:uncharacterized protein LOC113293734 [Papaver somniferum]|uniref:uncharacterized protein LOC113293734 n=1 Tax=Papaver somniferum TaxID=3469 RepID=UPI000E6FE4CB|nr:uncharacterized protein LOC113293734 [Papaver somniferum]XP_026398064.1 uncharacterized protein LOC113293734 [Papaver somniferum]